MEQERRFFDAGGIEVRRASRDAAQVLTIRGYAAKFGVLSENLGGFREQIEPGAFADILGDDVRALFNHDANHVLGRTASGTLRLWQDETGLGYEVDLPDTQAARDLAVSIERGDVSQSSFAFRLAPNGDRWDENEDGVVIRTISRFGRLYDVSPVTYPAYPDATIGMRSLQAWQDSRKVDAKPAGHKRQAAARLRLLTLMD